MGLARAIAEIERKYLTFAPGMIPSTRLLRLSSLWVELPLRGFVGLLLLTSWLGLYAQPLTGTHNITGTSAFNATGGQFATIQEAYDSLMARGVGLGGVTFRVQDSWVGSATGQNAEPNTIRLSTYPGSAPNAPVLLTFADLTNPVYLAKSPATGAGDRFVFRFTGNISYFTIDGANKLILKTTTNGATSTGLIGFVSTGSLNLQIDAITVRNIIMHGNSRANTFSGVYIGQDGTLTTGTVSAGSNIGAVRGITIEGCTIDSVSRPIFVAGIRSNTRNIRILNDTLGHPTDTAGWCNASGIGAIHVRGAVGVTVRGNVVHPERSSFSNVAGIRLDSCEASTIARNWIKGVVYLGTGGLGAYGIALAIPSTYTSPTPQTIVSNNMIAGIYADGDGSNSNGFWVISGIWVNAPAAVTNAQVALIHNSIRLFDDPVLSGLPPLTSYVGASAGITLGSNIQGGVTINGNLIQNKLAPRQRGSNNQAAYGILIYASTLASSTINYQCYRVNASPANNFIGCLGNPATPANNHATLAAWQTAISGEANGQTHVPGDVPFVSNTDLHLVSTLPSTAINAGDAALYNGTQDFDGETRPLPTGPSANTPPDPGTAPDIGADELDGTPFSCPSSLQAPEIAVTTTYPPLAGSDYLWGQQVEIDTTGTNSPVPSGSLNLAYSLDGGATWTAGPAVTAFPVTITLPSFTPPNYTGTLLIRVVATAPSFCSLTPDSSDTPVSLNLTDRPGNRAVTAIPVTLTPSGSGTWTAVIQDSTDGPGISNEYNVAGGARLGTAARDLFFVLTLPECLDSLVLNTCSGNTTYDTRIHLINATDQDSLTNEDQGSANCSSAGFGNPQWTSQLVAIGRPNTNRYTTASILSLVRDTVLLVSSHTYYIVVEGYESGDLGNFELTITGYKGPRPSSISVSGAPTAPVCINSAPINLNATTGATTYLWTLNGTPVPGQNGASVTLPPAAEGTFNVVAVAVYNPNEDPTCPTAADSVASSSVTITVEDTARAQIADASNTIVSNQTLSFTAGSNVTLNVSSPQTSGNTYTWSLYNSIPPSGTPTTSTGNSLTINNIAAGDYTVTLEAVRGTGACGPTRDTVYLSVTTGLRTEGGAFGIFPNPNTGVFTIAAPATDTYRVQVLDVAGRLVAQDAFVGSTHQMRLTLPAGVYQIRLLAGDRVQVGRLIITE